MKRIIIAIAAILALAVEAKAQHGQYVGGDLSMLPAYEAHNSAYLDKDGKKITDLIKYVKNEAGWNAVRVRLFVNPKEKSPREGIIQDLEYTKALGKRIKDAGMNFMLDFHYSDVWADPTHQKLPSAWADCTTADQKAERLYSYTKECLQALVAAGATPDLVQVGNEISYGIVDVKVHPYDNNGDDWTGFVTVLSKGCQAVREVCPDAKIVIHTERVAKSADTKYFYNKLASVDYDVIGLSYYPIWHGPIATLKGTLDMLKENFPTKEVQIVETAYNFQYWPSSGVTFDTRNTWACSAEGQYKFVRSLLDATKDYENVTGLFYWFPEEAGNGDDSDWNNGGATVIGSWLSRGLWYPDNKNGHWPVTYNGDGVVWMLKDFLSADAASITHNQIPNTHSQSYNLSGQKVGKGYKGIVIRNGKKYIIK